MERPLIRKLLLMFGSLVVLLVLLGLGGYWYARRSLVEASGRTQVAGLTQPVEIVRDEHAIPHIYARSPEDAYLGLGYVHAQDRLWQLELARRFGSGTLSELLGARAIEADRLFRTLGLARVARDNYATLPADVRAALDAYTAGINAYLREQHPLPPEFSLLRGSPAAWRPSDSIVILKLMGWRLSGNWDAELWRLRLGAQLSPRQLAEFATPARGTDAIVYEPLWQLYDQLGLPHPAPSDAKASGLPFPTKSVHAPKQGESAWHDAPPATLRSLRAIATELRRFAPSNFGRAVGSNNWALDGSRTASGKPLLANDPHLALTTPSQWYFAHLDAPGLRVIGASIPGLPGIILGRNDSVAWAFTNTLPDTQDVYFEKVVQGAPSKVQTPDGQEPFRTRQELIHVRGADDVKLTVRATRHGPVISDLTQVARETVPAGHVLTLAWTGLRSDDQTLAFPVLAARARTAGELREAARSFHTPSQNIVYADVAGAVGFVAAGRVPRRGAGNILRGLVPSPGWLPEYDWQGFVPFDELPQRSVSENGRIVTANQKITPPDYPLWLGGDWGPSYRADRIASLLDAQARHDTASQSRIQADVHSAIADQLVEPLLAALGTPTDERERYTQTTLAAWDREARADATAPLLFAAWLRELSRFVYEDELGAMFPQEWEPRPEFLVHVLQNHEGQARWCDDRRTGELESCKQQSKRALAAAFAQLERRFGKDPQTWRWGRAHLSRAAHPVLGGLPVVSALFDLRVARGGDSSTVDVGSYWLEEDETAFENHWGPGFRAIYDLKDPERSVGILNSGQSGHPLSPHYRDMLLPWSRGEHVPLITDRARIEPRALGTWVLEPAH